MYWAHLDSGYYTFDAFGETALEAEAALARGFKRHCLSARIGFGSQQLEILGDASTMHVRMGLAYRDRDMPIDARFSKGERS